MFVQEVKLESYLGREISKSYLFCAGNHSWRGRCSCCCVAIYNSLLILPFFFFNPFKFNAVRYNCPDNLLKDELLQLGLQQGMILVLVYSGN
jgi:hypothetical protein